MVWIYVLKMVFACWDCGQVGVFDVESRHRIVEPSSFWEVCRHQIRIESLDRFAAR